MSTKKNSDSRKNRAPKGFQKPLREKKFIAYRAMLQDADEKAVFENTFTTNEKGRRVFEQPSDKKAAKEIIVVLKKLRKARTGPRTFRLILLLLILGIPALFTVFFLDDLASRKLEGLLETLTETDVDVEGLDIRLLNGSVELAHLGFASTVDPMTDSLVLSRLALDFSLKAALQRRVNIDALTGTFDFSQKRTKPARYPAASDGTGSESTENGGTDAGVNFKDWLPQVDVPNSSITVAERLRNQAEAEAEAWEEALTRDKAQVEEQILAAEAFINKPLPAQADVAGWIARIDEGRAMAESIREYESLISGYRMRLEKARSDAAGASAEVQKTLADDLAVLEESLIPDNDMINEWISAALEAYAGPRIAGAYTRFMRLNGKIAGLRTGNGAEKNGDDVKERVNRKSRGRLVPFPVTLSPRFTVSELDMRSGDSYFLGSDLGIDHDLAGAPSIFELALTDIPGLSGHIAMDGTVDGRADAAITAVGNFSMENLSWSIASGASSASGLLSLAGKASLSAGSSALESMGSASLHDWGEGSGDLNFLKSGAPKLTFDYTGLFDNGIKALSLSLDSSSLADWAIVLAETFLPAGADAARKELEAMVGTELSGIDSVLSDWNRGKSDLDDMDSALALANDALEELINDMVSQSGTPLPVEIPGGGLGGLNKLF